MSVDQVESYSQSNDIWWCCFFFFLTHKYVNISEVKEYVNTSFGKKFTSLFKHEMTFIWMLLPLTLHKVKWWFVYVKSVLLNANWFACPPNWIIYFTIINLHFFSSIKFFFYWNMYPNKGFSISIVCVCVLISQLWISFVLILILLYVDICLMIIITKGK